MRKAAMQLYRARPSTRIKQPLLQLRFHGNVGRWYWIMPPLCQKALPLSLCVCFDVKRRDRLLNLLRFLVPITTQTAWKALVI